MGLSKEYQAIEVRNILDAYNQLLEKVIENDESTIINEEIIKDFNKQIGKDLGVHFNGIPGKYRDNIVVV